MPLDPAGFTLHLIEVIREKTSPFVTALEILLLDIHAFGLRCCIFKRPRETEVILGRKDDAVGPNQPYPLLLQISLVGPFAREISSLQRGPEGVGSRTVT